MTVPALSGKVSARLGKPPHPTPEWAGILVTRVRRWYPDREIVLIGDGAYAALALVAHCQQLLRPVCFIFRAYASIRAV